MNLDKAIAELRVELAALDIAIAVINEHLGCVSQRHQPSSTATRKRMALVQGKRGAIRHASAPKQSRKFSLSPASKVTPPCLADNGLDRFMPGAQLGQD
jgi:hypothetical protein